MKRIYFLTLIATVFMMPLFSSAQSNMVYNAGLEEWDDANTPTGWNKYENISQESTIVHEGSYSAAQISASSSKKFRQNIQGVVPGTTYTVSFWFLDNDPAAKCRIWSYWLKADGSYLDDNAEELRPSTFSVDNPDWQHFVVQVTAPDSAAKFRFEVRAYKESGNTGGKVYYDDFYFGTEEQVLPEPSNYPTDFTATAYKVFIDLSWTDAAGDQLPTGYLIYGYKDGVDMPVPTDGFPVEDDDDWSDGIASGNVPFGMNSVRVDGLDANTTYHFVIYPFTNAGENIDYKTDGTPPTASATTENVELIEYWDFDDEFGPWNAYDVAGEQHWEVKEYNGNKFAKMSGYQGGSHANEDWLISGPYSLPTDTPVFFNFDNSYKYDGEPLKFYVSTNYDGSGNPNDFEWTDLSDEATWSEGNYTWANSGDIDLSNFGGSAIYLAFKYTSTDEASSTWKIDNTMLFKNITTGVNDIENAEISVFPNPARDVINVNTNAEGVVSVADLTGKTVMTEAVNKGENRLNISNLHPGVYFVILKTSENNFKAEKLIVK